MELLPDLNIPNDVDTVAWNSCHLRWRLGDILKVFFLKELNEDFFQLGYLLDPYQSYSEYAHHHGHLLTTSTLLTSSNRQVSPLPFELLPSFRKTLSYN